MQNILFGFNTTSSQSGGGSTRPGGFTGPTGPPGFGGGGTGFTGPQGPTGPFGGPKGDTGPKGDMGYTGFTGPKGDNGNNGTNGGKGDTGLTGATGPKGDNGQKGDTGMTGPTGPFGGQKGDVGDTGPRGYTGQTGATGPKGDPGNPATSSFKYAILKFFAADPNCSYEGVEGTFPPEIGTITTPVTTNVISTGLNIALNPSNFTNASSIGKIFVGGVSFVDTAGIFYSTTQTNGSYFVVKFDISTNILNILPSFAQSWPTATSTNPNVYLNFSALL